MKYLNIKKFYIIIIILLNLLNDSFVKCTICPNYCTCKWFLNELHVDCSNLNLQKIPLILLKLPVNKLNLSNNNIKKFPNELSYIKTLNTLDLTNNKIDYIEKNALNNFNTLKQLILNSNNLTKWNNINPNYILLPAKNLELLSLDGNKFIEIPNILNDMYNIENDNNNENNNYDYDFNIDEIQNYYNNLYMNNENITLYSETLITLNLNNCGIKYIHGKKFLNGLKNLKTLYLNDNQLTVIPKLISNNLQNLYISNCKLNKIDMNSLVHLKQLQTLDLSKNPDLTFINNNNYYIKNTNTNNNNENDNDDNDKKIIKTITNDNDNDDNYDGDDNDQIKLLTLKYLNLSLCNLHKINFLQYFPNLIQINLSDNLIHDIKNIIFNNYCKNLEIINLSLNSITLIHLNTFINLTKLYNINLSFNTISRIDNNLFSTNTKLLNINLSRNYINELNDINSKSLLHLDISCCEIINISNTAFNYLPNIRDINLSSNLIEQLPDGLQSNTLENFNLSDCRLSSINNETFSNLPELTILDLSGNRFTTTFKIDYFLNNGFLQFIYLSDNPWRCDCKESSFFTFNSYLMKNPTKLSDRQYTTCETPSYHYKKTWHQACYGQWFPDSVAGSNTTSAVFLILFIIGILSCMANVLRKCYMNSREQQDLLQHERNIEEQISTARYNQMVVEQEALLNAPDPRETNPPSYEDALHMPRLVRPFQSMNELAAKRSKRRLRRSTTTNDMNDNNESDHENSDDNLVLDPITFHSEEIISERNTERTLNINNDKKFRNKDYTSKRFHANDRQFSSSYYKAQNLESAEKIASFRSLEHSPYSIRKPKPYNKNNNQLNDNEDNNQNLTEIKEFNWMKSSDIIENYSSSIENSPYTTRKPKSLKINENSSSKNSLILASSSSASNNKNDIELISSKYCQSSNESNENETFV